MTREHTGWTGYHVNPTRPEPKAGSAPASRLVVALDGTDFAERSLETADALSAASGLPLHLVRVCGDEADLAEADVDLRRAARRTPRVTQVALEIGTDVAGHLAGLAETGALVVLATHARGAVGDVLFGSVADVLLRETSRPVLLVGPEAGVPDPHFSTLVVPDDAGEGAWRVRDEARTWSELLGAVPLAVQVLPTAAPAHATDVLESAHIQSVAKELGAGAEWEVLHGDEPAERIVELARERNAGLIAMTVTPRHRIGPDIAGGVALHVIRHAPCAVLALGRATS